MNKRKEILILSIEVEIWLWVFERAIERVLDNKKHDFIYQ